MEGFEKMDMPAGAVEAVPTETEVNKVLAELDAEISKLDVAPTME